MKTLFDSDHPSWSGAQLAWLLSHKGIGSARAVEIARTVPDPATFRDKWPDAVRRMPSWARNVPPGTPADDTPYEDVACVGMFDGAYPRRLASIPNPPAVLWIRGELPSLERAAAVVGTRRPDDWGAAVASQAARWCADNDTVVVSGLALGCDAIAHEATLGHSGTTVAVLGGSLLLPSPAQNRGLADRILETGGALVSEVPPSTDVSPHTLVQRNRIQTGLSNATVVAQTGIPGGTLHTARFTLEQGRHLVVGKPTGAYANRAASAGNLLLTQSPPPKPEAIASALRTTKGFEHDLAARSRIADAAPETRDELFDTLVHMMR